MLLNKDDGIRLHTAGVSTTTNLGAPPPLILGFHPSKRHAALIASRDQGSIVLAITLVLLVLKRFCWRVLLVILMFVARLLVDSSCVYFLTIYEYHVISARSHFNLILIPIT